jgi:hypothetical protein
MILMVDEIKVYVSSAPELYHERDLLGRLIAEIPVTLGWRIIHTPTKGEPVNVDAITTSDIHLLVMGSDIRAPIGFEWLIALRAARNPWLFLKQDVLQTSAAQDFVRRLAEHGDWKLFNNNIDLRRMVEQQIAEHILAQSRLYAIQGDELETLIKWKNGLDKKEESPIDDFRFGAGDSGVIISPERYVPREGVLINPPKKEAKDE